jgi:WD40 repeat protein
MIRWLSPFHCCVISRDEGVFNDWPMSTNKEGNYFSIAGVKFSHNQKFIVLATSTGWIQLYSTKSGRLVCQFEVDAEICSICISPNDCFVGVGLNDGRVRES